jgi:hypothetical protein
MDYKNFLFNEDGSVYFINNLEALLDTFELTELEALFKLNLYYNELNIDLMELVALGYLEDVNQVGYEQINHENSIKIIKEYTNKNFNKSFIKTWEQSMHYDWRDKKPKNLTKRK